MAALWTFLKSGLVHFKDISWYKFLWLIMLTNFSKPDSREDSVLSPGFFSVAIGLRDRRRWIMFMRDRERCIRDQAPHAVYGGQAGYSRNRCDGNFDPHPGLFPGKDYRSRMRKTGFSDAMIADVLREARAHGVAAASERYRLTQQTVYSWLRSYGTLEAAQIAALRAANSELTRLRKRLQERDLEVEVLKELVSKKF
jgi:putative transposase